MPLSKDLLNETQVRAVKAYVLSSRRGIRSFSFNLLRDAWRDWLDPRTRAQMAAQEFSR